MVKDSLNGIWPEWKIVRQIGQGSFGVVYEAERVEHQLKSHAAIKVISIPQNDSEIESLRSEGMNRDSMKTYLEGVVNDFVGEIQLMESFKGVQNIVNIEDYKVVEKNDGIGWNIYIRMELLIPLSEYCHDHPLTEKDVIRLGCDICTALELCEQCRVIHRDIKPGNIFVNAFGHFKLGDFGVARRLENLTGGLSKKGTYNYMAPEVARNMQYDASVDLYSLGLVLYRFMNENRPPFLTSSQMLNPNAREAAVRRRMDGEPLPPPCNASPYMKQVILRACSPDPAKRFASAAEMKKALSESVSEDIWEKTMPLYRKQQLNEEPEVEKTVVGEIGTFGKSRKYNPGRNIPVILAVSLLVCIIVFVFRSMNKVLDGIPGKDTHYYKVFDEQVSTWEDAEVYCELLGGHLVTITDERENEKVYELMLDAGYSYAYIGLSDADEEGVWTWVTGEALEYTDWHEGEPNNDSVSNDNLTGAEDLTGEDYAMYYYDKDGLWNDNDFGIYGGGGTAFICEWDSLTDYQTYEKIISEQKK